MKSNRIRCSLSRTSRASLLIGGVWGGMLMLLPGCPDHQDPAPGIDNNGGAGGGGGQSPGADTAAPAYTAPPLQWAACEGEFQCATLRVPLDYHQPQGETIEVALIRLPSTNEGAHLGSLILNPGGPGGSGLEFLRADKEALKTLRTRFDLVSFDPRGVGKSGGISCRTDAERDAELAQVDGATTLEQKLDQTIEEAKQFAANCASRDGKLLPYVSTEYVARDMNVLYRALGDEKINYLGYSYGTFLGATYASLFPETIRTMVLDGALNPSTYINTHDVLYKRQVSAFNVEAQRALDACKAAGPQCPFGAGNPDAALTALAEHIRTEPVPTKKPNDPRVVNTKVFQSAIVFAMYNRSLWGFLFEALAEAQGGDGTKLMRLSDASRGRKDDGTYTNAGDAIEVITCADVPAPDEASARDVFGTNTDAWNLFPCVYLPKPVSRFTGPFEAKNAAPLLVVATTGDPATPYSEGVALAEQLASSVLLTWKGQGHTAYSGPSTCINTAVETYLFTQTTPEKGTKCD